MRRSRSHSNWTNADQAKLDRAWDEVRIAEFVALTQERKKARARALNVTRLAAAATRVANATFADAAAAVDALTAEPAVRRRRRFLRR
jgi:hypothetical protein